MNDRDRIARVKQNFEASIRTKQLAMEALLAPIVQAAEHDLRVPGKRRQGIELRQWRLCR